MPDATQRKGEIMRISTRLGKIAASTAIVGAVLGGAVLAAAPASAAPKCGSITKSNGAMAVTCSGIGKARFVDSCPAIAPFTPWTKYSPWYTFLKGEKKTLIYQFPVCGVQDKAHMQVK
ncbi:hypothetical protein [Curtobacterium sp. L1-20]|uniref:hypothetical protein n=1 Tax=Curtobacterium sp. L1-20 TaxID=3138181 RepID=UPI003B52C766